MLQRLANDLPDNINRILKTCKKRAFFVFLNDPISRACNHKILLMLCLTNHNKVQGVGGKIQPSLDLSFQPH